MVRVLMRWAMTAPQPPQKGQHLQFGEGWLETMVAETCIRCGGLGHKPVSWLGPWRASELWFIHVGACVRISILRLNNTHFIYSLMHKWIFFHNSSPIGWKWCLTVIPICISLLICDVEHPFMYLLASLIIKDVLPLPIVYLLTLLQI